jgi:hypothetical protein
MNDTEKTTDVRTTGETREVFTTGLSYPTTPTELIDTSTEELTDNISTIEQTTYEPKMNDTEETTDARTTGLSYPTAHTEHDISTKDETKYEPTMNDSGETTYALKTGETRDVSTTGLSYSLIPTEHIDTSTEELTASELEQVAYRVMLTSLNICYNACAINSFTMQIRCTNTFVSQCIYMPYTYHFRQWTFRSFFSIPIFEYMNHDLHDNYIIKTTEVVHCSPL